jgi:hypothetical protein
MSDELAKINERLMTQINNLQLEVDEAMTHADEAYGSLDWANRIDRDYLWIRTSGATSPQFRFMTKETIDTYTDICNFMAVYNPLIKRIVDVKTMFTFSRGVTVISDNPAVDKIQKDDLNKQAFFSHQALGEIDAELQKSGNVFIPIWKGKQQVRAWSSYEIRDIVFDEEDSSRPVFYIRVWQDAEGKEHKRAYPSVFAQPVDIPSGKTQLSYQGQTYDVSSDVTVYHMSTTKPLKAKFALTELVSACRWAKPHEKFLEDFAAIVSAVRKYTHSFTAKTTGGAAALRTQLQGNTDYMGTSLQSNPAGSAVVAQEDTQFKVVDAGSNKIVGPADSRYFLNMVCAGSGVPETLLTGDPSTGNLATAKDLSESFLILVEKRQTMWTDALTIIFKTLLDSDDFEISFPSIRSKDAIAYVNALLATATLNSPGVWAGSMDAGSFVTAAYEALDLQLEDDVKEELITNLTMGMGEITPDADDNLAQLAQAAAGLAEAARGS